MSIAQELSSLFRRDLSRLLKQIEAFPDDETLWHTRPEVTNSAGNLTLHIEGNLREFIGRQLGKIDYSRTRDLEFSSKGVSRQELIKRVAELKLAIPSVIAGLSSPELEAEYPEIVLERATSTQELLIHLYGHLNWHLGQIDYLRRIITDGTAVKAVGLEPVSK